MAPASSSYYASAPGQFGSGYSANTSYGYSGPSMVDFRGIPISSMSHSNPSAGYSESGYPESASGYSNPTTGYSQPSRSYTNSQSGMVRTFHQENFQADMM
jgi:hypothetical protein